MNQNLLNYFDLMSVLFGFSYLSHWFPFGFLVKTNQIGYQLKKKTSQPENGICEQRMGQRALANRALTLRGAVALLEPGGRQTAAGGARPSLLWHLVDVGFFPAGEPGGLVSRASCGGGPKDRKHDRK